MESNFSNMGTRIKQARKKAKLSQREFAKRLGKTIRTIQKYESGEIYPALPTIEKMADIFHIEPIELMGYQKKIQLETLSDIYCVMRELDKLPFIHFDIIKKSPPEDQEWSVSLRFDGNHDTNSNAPNYNADICLFWEEYEKQKKLVANNCISPQKLDEWFHEKIISNADKFVVQLPIMQSINLSIELDRQSREEQND